MTHTRHTLLVTHGLKPTKQPWHGLTSETTKEKALLNLAKEGPHQAPLTKTSSATLRNPCDSDKGVY